jgi:predicted nucleotidyltransferase component of viral defense system
MSEDIDLRVISETKPARAALKRLRRQVSDRLRAIGFTVDDEHIKVQHSDTYVRYDLPYAPIMRGEGVLRPEIKIEISAFPTRRPLIDRAVTSFVAEANNDPAEIPKIACVSLVEIAAEKFVALTRRSGAAFAGVEALDSTLPRHVYDLSRLDGHYDAEDAARLALDTMKDDAATRGGDFPAYQADPLGETLRAVGAMASHRAFAADYSILMDAMVYGDKPAFDDAMAVVRGLAGRGGRRVSEVSRVIGREEITTNSKPLCPRSEPPAGSGSPRVPCGVVTDPYPSLSGEELYARRRATLHACRSRRRQRTEAESRP